MAEAKNFESIAVPHLDALYKAAVALCDRRDHAEDLVQATFMKALQRFDSFRPGTNCKAWLLRILRNTWIDELRHRKIVGPSVPIEEHLLADPRQAEAPPRPGGEGLEDFSDEQVIRALGQLPDDQRVTLLLVDVEQLGYEEVAEITEAAVGTVKSRTWRARAALKEKLQAHAEELGFLRRKS